MTNQRNMTPAKETTKTPVVKPKEMDTYQLYDKKIQSNPLKEI